MAIVNINTIKNWFKTGMIPTQDQFWSVFDSYRHKSDKVPVADIEGINELLATRASQQVLDNHLAQKGAPNGYAPLDEFTKLAAQYLNIVNDLVTGGATALLSAEQGKVLQTQVSAINTLLTSDNVNLDTVQELVDAIETVQLSLSSILVNDLTTGGTTKALTAEMGKTLKGLIDGLLSIKKNKVLAITTEPAITKTLSATDECILFTSTNPVTFTIPTNASVAIPIGTEIQYTQQGDGVVTVGGAGITFVTNLALAMAKGETRTLTKIGTDTWTVEGNIATTATDNFFVKILGKTFVNSLLREGLKGIMLGVPDFNWGGSGRFFRFGNRSSLSEASNGAIILLTGAYESGLNQYKYIATGQAASYIRLSSSGDLSFFAAPPGLIDDFVYFAERFTIRSGGVFLVNSLENNSDLMQIGGSITAIQFNLENLNGAPLTSNSAGRKGEIRFTQTHIFVCVATNTWVRTALTTW